MLLNSGIVPVKLPQARFMLVTVLSSVHLIPTTFVGTRINHIFSFCIGGEVPGFACPITAVGHSRVIPISPPVLSYSSCNARLVLCGVWETTACKRARAKQNMHIRCRAISILSCGSLDRYTERTETIEAQRVGMSWMFLLCGAHKLLIFARIHALADAIIRNPNGIKV